MFQKNQPKHCFAIGFEKKAIKQNVYFFQICEKTASCIQNLKTLNILVNLWSLQDQVYQISSLFVENCLQGVNGGNISCRDRRSGSFYLDENLGSVVFLCFFFFLIFLYLPIIAKA